MGPASPRQAAAGRRRGCATCRSAASACPCSRSARAAAPPVAVAERQGPLPMPRREPVPRSCVSLELPDADIAQGQRARVVALDAEITLRRFSKVGIFLGIEFARLDRRVPLGAADVIGHDLLAVQPLLDMLALGD